MKYLGEFIRDRKFELPIAYYDLRYRRDASPLLDHLACVIDHVEAHSTGGSSTEDNLTVSCNKCNVRKNNRRHDIFISENPPRAVKGKYGEPRDWDGLAAVFVVLCRGNTLRLTASERVWLRELEAHVRRARTSPQATP
jgi:hypothetical protein